MSIRVSLPVGCVLLCLVLLCPAIVIAYFFNSIAWLFVVPMSVLGLVILIGVLRGSPKVSPEQFAERLEKHLLGTEGEWDWDDTTSVRVADERLDRLRRYCMKFDSLRLDQDRDELKGIIAALRRGEVPEVQPVKSSAGPRPRPFRLIRKG